MADVAIETSVQTTFHTLVARAGPFWTSPTVGYIIYINSADDLKYRKTTNGGAAWGDAVNIRTGTIRSFDCWADWQVVGDTGTKIHIAYLDENTDDARYVYLDTDGDSVDGDDQIEACQGDGTLNPSTTRALNCILITKTRGGNIAVALRYNDNSAAAFYMFYTSPDGNTWTSKTAPWEATNDYALLFPGNEADNQDVWMTFWDKTANEISLKTYDDSEDSWSEQSMAVLMFESSSFLQQNGAIRISDGHLIFAAWSQLDNLASDLRVWDINGAASITEKTSVITNTAEYITTAVFVNQVNDDIYVAYLGGATAGTAIAALYKKSTNGGDNWGDQTAMQANAEDDEKWIGAGAMRGAWGGKFQPVWFNEDLGDIFTNSDNGISIEEAVAAIIGPFPTHFVTP